MPSPIGHALAGVAAGLTLARPRSGRCEPGSAVRVSHPPWQSAALYALIAIAPDFDLLAGSHSAQSHSAGAALIAGLLASVLVRAGRRAGFSRNLSVTGLAVAAAYGSHVLLDWLGNDTSAPIGVMALWPLTESYYQSEAYLFPAISRRYWLDGFWRQNLTAVFWELVLLGPPGLAAWAWRARQRRREAASA